MPLIFTKSEIRQQLYEIGFEPDDKQLKEFILDLKKLIKTEEKQRRDRKAAGLLPSDGDKENGYPPNPLSFSPPSTEHTSSFSTTNTSITSTTVNDKDVATIAGDDIDQGDTEPPPTFPVQPPRPTDTRQTAKTLPKKMTTAAAAPASKRVLSESQVTSKTSLSSCSSYSSSFELDLDLSSDNGSDEGDTAQRRRIKLPPKSVRHDPVSLYHFYKSYWDKQKVPGEDPRMQLRWNVRAGTLGRIPCDANGVPTKYLR